MTQFLALLGPLGLGASVVVSAYTFLQGLFALRAKNRARYTIREHAQIDSELLHYLEKAAARPLAPSEAEHARDAIERAICTDQTLSEQDKKFVEEGLDQSSRAGTVRYVNDMLAPAKA